MNPFVMILPLLILEFGAIVAGYLFKELFIGYDSLKFWQNLFIF